LGWFIANKIVTAQVDLTRLYRYSIIIRASKVSGKNMSQLKNTSYLFGSNAVFIEELYSKYSQDPSSVDQEWQNYFKSLNDNSAQIQKAATGAAWKPYKNRIIGAIDKEELKAKPAKTANAAASTEDMHNSLKAANLINSYRTYGHTDVVLDPLGLKQPAYHPELDYKSHGFSDADLDKTIHLGGTFGVENAPLRDLVHTLKSIYSNRVAAEFMHIESAEERNWLQRKLELTAGTVSISLDEKKTALQDIMEAEMFESFLHTKFPGTKRFSVEGLENSISCMEVIVRNSVQFGVREYVLGMAHRGRLNTLTKVMGKPYHAMLSEFKGELAFPDNMGIPGDVKYHLGTSSDIEIDGHKVHLSLTPNPSHLEVVNAVVLGRVRAKQDLRKDTDRSQVLGILVHGDAAFAGQGSVMEALALSQLKAYHTGGTMHVVSNNQIGFTTNPEDSRSTLYSTDIAKFIGAPIFHVNGDDAEAVVFVSKLASEYRAKFKKDVVIDVVGYRKYGHNEGDEPFFTQPVMYAAIKNKENPAQVYANKLISEGLVSAAEFETMQQTFKQKLDAEFTLSVGYKPNKADWLSANWSEFEAAKVDREEVVTGVKASKLKELGNKLCEYPKEFNINTKVLRQLEAKKKMIETGKDIDWGTGEALAFASLLDEGFHIRMSGQDVKRGTFSHRHAVLFDQETQQEFAPLNHLSDNQKAKLEIYNSNLSEFAVLAFEYGYSYADPMSLTIWEAQFGDFVNGAQVIIDQYISSGEAKWLRMSGLTMLLPHGYEGQGPEHSSARLERFLQSCASDNMQVLNCTTPASIYHALRRQQKRNFRKPLVVMSPKSLLRHKLAVSTFDEMKEGTKFEPVLGDKEVSANKVTKAVICSGKVYYDLFEKRQELGRQDIALIRMEQLYPFPTVQLGMELAKYPNAEVIWCQEEHENMGAFYFVEPRIEKVLKAVKHKSTRARYIGRDRSASPAVGYMKLHTVESKKIMDSLFG
jgi:2-oxoglutarate dehydrogenase E1 component